MDQPKVTKEIALKILGLSTVEDSEKDLIDILKFLLAGDNNKWREVFVSALCDYSPTLAGKGYPDAHKKNSELTCVDMKSGPIIMFPDGGNSIAEKYYWVCSVSQYNQFGDLLYIAEIEVKDIMDELVESASKLVKNKQRVSPVVGWKTWFKKPSVKVLYKNQSLVDHYKQGYSSNGETVPNTKPFWKELDSLPYESIL